MNRFDQPFSPRRFLVAFLISAALAAPGLTRANPIDPVVTHGDATFDQVGGHLTINQLTDRAVIDWQSFSISAGEITKFVQPAVNSAVLNRVRGNAASFIDGQLRANGRVFLLNSNGILIGPNGYIDTAGFVASTLDVDSDEFMRGGDLHFRGTSNASVVNLGTIKASAGDVVLIGANVRNSGTILAPRGTVALGGGQDVILMATGDSRIKVRTGKGVVINQGVIEANRAELEAHHGNVGALAIRNDGRIAATAVTRKGGRIFLSAGGKGKIRNTGTLKARARPEVEAKPEIRIEAEEVEAGGTIDASSETDTGGYIAVQAREVLVPSGTVVLADGETGGGQINIGGGLRGSDPELRNATRVVVEENSEISVDAHRISNGGIAVVFAEGRLDFNGRVSATGGIQGGNGGFVKLSGREEVHLSNLSEQVKIGAPNGQSGTLLLDPIDITITSGVNDGIVAGTSITDGSIINFLENSGNLIIDSSSGGGTQTLSEFDNDPIAANIQAPGHQSRSSIIADGSPFSTFSPFTFSPGSATGNPKWPHQLFAVPSTVNTTLSGAGTVTLLVNGTDGTVYYGVGPIPNVVGTAGLVRIDDGPANVTFTPGETAFIYYDIRNTTNGPTTYAELTAGQLFGYGVNDILQLTEAGGAGNGDITINSGADITWTSSNSLTFNASGSFQNNGSISGAGDLVVTAADFDNSGIIDGIGSVTVTAPGTVALNEYIRGSSVVINAIDLGDGVSMVVDTTADVVDGTTASSTALLYDSGGQISLREAFLASNNDSLHNEIGFSPGLDGSPILLSIGAELEDAAAEGDLDVISGSTITLHGRGLGNTIIDANDPDVPPNPNIFDSYRDRVFHTLPGGTLFLNNLTAQNGRAGNKQGTARPGGGLLRNQGSTTITDSLLTGGTAFGVNGGAIRMDSGSLTINNSTLSNNFAGGHAGAIYIIGGTTNITGSTLSQNHANSFEGGAIRIQNANLDITNSTLSGNDSNKSGGAIYHASGNTTIINSTIAGNIISGTGDGDGIFCSTNGSFSLNNSIVAGNNGPEDIWGTVSGSNNIIGTAAASGGLTHGVNGNIVGNAGSGTLDINTVLNPTLANNEGLTMTHALVPGSPAINAGDNTFATNAGLTTDQALATRIQNGIVDIGSMEFFLTDVQIIAGTGGGVSGTTITDGAIIDYLTNTGNLLIGGDNITIDPGVNINWASASDLSFNAATNFTNNGVVDSLLGTVDVTAAGAVTLEDYIRGFDVTINAIPLGDGVSMVVDTSADVINGTTTSSTALLYNSGGQISLREAFMAANNDSLPNAITFSSAINGSAIRLTGSPDEDLAASGDLDVINGSTITLNGNGLSNTIIEAGPDMASATDRVFDLRPGGGATLELNNLTVRNGNGPSGGGGLVRNQGTLRATNSLFTGGTAPGDGGALASSLDLELTNSTVSNSSSGTGGGIRVSGSASIENSTLSGNTASANGGGIASLGVGTVLSLTNTTLSGNTASSGGGLSDTSSGGSTFVTNATITGNNGGGVHTTSGSTQLDNTIVAGNPGGDILGGSIAANSFNNLIGDAATSGGLINGVSGNIVGNEGSGSMAIASILNPTLANNGGSTLTHALVDFSHAINTGDNTVASDLTTDQTGASRVLEAIVDIGAVESSGLQMPLPPQPIIPEEVVEEVIEEAINTVDATSDTETTETDTGTETGGMTTDTNIGSEANNFTQSETGDGAPAAEGAATPESLMGQGDGGEGAATPAGGGEGAQSAGTTEGGETGDGGGTGGGETPAEGGSEGDGSTTGDGEGGESMSEGDGGGETEGGESNASGEGESTPEGEGEGSMEGEGGEGEGNMESDSADGDGAQGEGTQGEGSGGDGTSTDGGAAAGTGEGGTVETDNSTDGVFPSAEAPTTPPETVTPPQSSEQNPVVSISGGIPKPETEAAMTQSTQPGVEMALDAAVGGEGQADIRSTDGGISIGTESVEPPAPVTTQALDQNTGYQAMSEFDQAFGGDGSFDVPPTSNSPAPMSFDAPPPSPQVASSIVNAVDPAAASNMARSFGFQGTVPVDPGAGATGVTPQDFMSNPATQQALENSTSPDAQQEMVDAMNSLLE